MRTEMRISMFVVLGIVAGGGISAVSIAQDGGKEPAPSQRQQKIRQLFESLGYPARVRDDLQARALQLTKGDAAKAKEIVAKSDPRAAEEFVLGELEKRVDNKALDAMLSALGSPDGKRLLSSLRLSRGLLVLDLAMTPADSSAELEPPGKAYRSALDKGMEKSGPMNLAQNEKYAIAALRNLAVAQAQLQASDKIDGDEDGIGEYGTLLELSGAVGVRKGRRPGHRGGPPGTDFSEKGAPVKPPILSAAFAAVDANGIVVKDGYCFRVFLPDQENEFVHETGPAASVGLGGSKWGVGDYYSETSWCAYAWPEKRLITGTRAFFINHIGDVLESSNQAAQWSGVENAPPGASAFLEKYFRADIAEGVKGSDGDVWKVVK